MNNAIPKTVDFIGGEETEYNEGIYERFISWRNQGGGSKRNVARILKRPGTLIEDYIKKEMKGKALRELEKDISQILLLKEDLRFSKRDYPFCSTEKSKLMWEVLQFCREEGKLGSLTADSGHGKTHVCIQYEKREPNVALVTLDITTRRPGSVLKLISRKLGCVSRSETISGLLHNIIDAVRIDRCMLILDDAHFLSWEALEGLRRIHDGSEMGMVLCGQPRLYDQMRGSRNNSYLFDQIFSRISIRRNIIGVNRDDVRLIADSICPNLDKDCIDFLFGKTQDKGHFRNLTNILRLSLRMSQEFNSIVDLNLLKEASRFLMI